MAEQQKTEKTEDTTTWNHRVVKSQDEDGTEYLTIQEVYYDDDKPQMHTLELGVEGETIDDLKDTLQRMLKCVDQPIMDEIPMDDSEEVWDDEEFGDGIPDEDSDSDSDELSDTANKK